MRKLLGNLIVKVLIVAFVAGVFAVLAPIDHGYWNSVYKIEQRSAPESVVVVTLDDRPNWSTASEAKLLDQLRRQMPRRVYFDARIDPGSDRAGDAALRRVIESYGGDIAFVARAEKIDQWDPQVFRFPPPSVIGNSPVYVSGWDSDFVFYPETAPYEVNIDGRSYETLSAAMAGVSGGLEPIYSPDFSIDPDTILRVSSSNLLAGRFAPGLLTGRTVIVSDPSQFQTLGYYGHGQTPVYAFDIAGAAALAKPFSIPFGGPTLNFGFVPMLAWMGMLLWLGSRERRRLRKAVVYLFALASTLVLPAMARYLGIVLTPEYAILSAALYYSVRLWQMRTRRIQHTSASGLPNLLALTAAPLPVGRDVVIAVIARYEEMLATLPKDMHGEFARQIARRLAIGSGCADIHQGDGGHFAWVDETRPIETQLNHFEGLRALFSAPLQVGDHTFDTNIHFGIDRNEGLDSLTRLNSALASANEALKNGRTVEYFEAARLAEAPWELSLHARIDEGLRNGDIWLAYQPQWDYREDRIAGAEALIRWNHPTRGPIQPDAFILQAERAGRIDTLTYWVLDQAISAAETMNALGPRFQVSINLSAQMVDKPSLVSSISEIVRRRGIDCRLLTIEVTETSSVHNRPAARQNLGQLRAMGFRLSIDDFGTGEASLSYLAELPSDELKLDKRFISVITSSDRNRKIVSSTIGLAHALGQVVVAEGIEDAATFQLLREMQCDHGQGYYIGKPRPFADLHERCLQAGLDPGGTVSDAFRDC